MSYAEDVVRLKLLPRAPLNSPYDILWDMQRELRDQSDKDTVSLIEFCDANKVTSLIRAVAAEILRDRAPATWRYCESAVSENRYQDVLDAYEALKVWYYAAESGDAESKSLYNKYEKWKKELLSRDDISDTPAGLWMDTSSIPGPGSVLDDVPVWHGMIGRYTASYSLDSQYPVLSVINGELVKKLIVWLKINKSSLFAEDYTYTVARYGSDHATYPIVYYVRVKGSDFKMLDGWQARDLIENLRKLGYHTSTGSKKEAGPLTVGINETRSRGTVIKYITGTKG